MVFQNFPFIALKKNLRVQTSKGAIRHPPNPTNSFKMARTTENILNEIWVSSI